MPTRPIDDDEDSGLRDGATRDFPASEVIARDALAAILRARGSGTPAVRTVVRLGATACGTGRTRAAPGADAAPCDPSPVARDLLALIRAARAAGLMRRPRAATWARRVAGMDDRALVRCERRLRRWLGSRLP